MPETLTLRVGLGAEEEKDILIFDHEQQRQMLCGSYRWIDRSRFVFMLTPKDAPEKLRLYRMTARVDQQCRTSWTLKMLEPKDYAATSRALDLNLLRLESDACPVTVELVADWKTGEFALSDGSELHFLTDQARDLLIVAMGPSCPYPWNWVTPEGTLCWKKISNFWGMPTLNYMLHLDASGHPTLVHDIKLPIGKLASVTWDPEQKCLLLVHRDPKQGQWRWHIPFAEPDRDARVLLAHLFLGLWSSPSFDYDEKNRHTISRRSSMYAPCGPELGWSYAYSKRLVEMCHGALFLIDDGTIFVLSPSSSSSPQKDHGQYFVGPLPAPPSCESLLLQGTDLQRVSSHQGTITCQGKQVFLTIDRYQYLLDGLKHHLRLADKPYPICLKVNEKLLQFEQVPSWQSIDSIQIHQLHVPWPCQVFQTIPLYGQISVNRAIGLRLKEVNSASRVRFDLDLEWRWWVARFASMIRENKVPGAFELLPNCHGMTHWAYGSPAMFLFETDDLKTVTLCVLENGMQTSVPLPNDPALKEEVLELVRQYLKKTCPYAGTTLRSELPYRAWKVTMAIQRTMVTFAPFFQESVSRDQLVSFIVEP